jgi:hypothetical protein
MKIHFIPGPGRRYGPEKTGKPTVFRIGDVCIETNEDCRPLLDFIRSVTRDVHPGPSK